MRYGATGRNTKLNRDPNVPMGILSKLSFVSALMLTAHYVNRIGRIGWTGTKRQMDKPAVTVKGKVKGRHEVTMMQRRGTFPRSESYGGNKDKLCRPGQRATAQITDHRASGRRRAERQRDAEAQGTCLAVLPFRLTPSETSLQARGLDYFRTHDLVMLAHHPAQPARAPPAGPRRL